MQHKGVIAQVLGPVVDVQFEAGALPQLNEPPHHGGRP